MKLSTAVRHSLGIKKTRRKGVNEILGISNAKRKIARATGIPTTKSGRKQKVRRSISKAILGLFK